MQGRINGVVTVPIHTEAFRLAGVPHPGPGHTEVFTELTGARRSCMMLHSEPLTVSMITLGLPIIRTSVDHGTAFDLAWRDIASPQSLYAAIRAAAELAGGK